MTAPVDVLAVLRRMQHTCDLDRRDNQIDGLANLDAELAGEESEAIAAVAELIEADREVDAVYDEMRRAHLAGPRPHSYGTGWETRDEAARKDRERRYEDAQARRDAALARVGGAA